MKIPLPINRNPISIYYWLLFVSLFQIFLFISLLKPNFSLELWVESSSTPQNCCEISISVPWLVSHWHFKVYDGLTVTAESLGRFCTPNIGVITSSSHVMLVVFMSDSVNELEGFTADVSSKPSKLLDKIHEYIYFPHPIAS